MVSTREDLYEKTQRKIVQGSSQTRQEILQEQGTCQGT
jgi:hypothetical protein